MAVKPHVAFVPEHQIDQMKKDPNGMMDFLRQATYAYSKDPVDPTRQGFEFEVKVRG